MISFLCGAGSTLLLAGAVTAAWLFLDDHRTAKYFDRERGARRDGAWRARITAGQSSRRRP